MAGRSCLIHCAGFGEIATPPTSEEVLPLVECEPSPTMNPPAEKSLMLRTNMLALCILTFALQAISAHAQDMPLSQVLLDGEDWQLVGEGYQFTEAPAVST